MQESLNLIKANRLLEAEALSNTMEDELNKFRLVNTGGWAFLSLALVHSLDPMAERAQEYTVTHNQLLENLKTLNLAE